jgi:hypothetical protein
MQKEIKMILFNGILDPGDKSSYKNPSPYVEE